MLGQSICGAVVYVAFCAMFVALALNIDLLGDLVTYRDYLGYISISLFHLTETAVIGEYLWEWNKNYIIETEQLVPLVYIWLFSTWLPFVIAFFLWFIEYACYKTKRNVEAWLYDDIISFVKGMSLCVIFNYCITVFISARMALPKPNFKDVCNFDFSIGECRKTDYKTLEDGLISYPNPEMSLMISTSFFISLFLSNKLIFCVNNHFYKKYYSVFRQSHFSVNEKNNNNNDNTKKIMCYNKKNENKNDVTVKSSLGLSNLSVGKNKNPNSRVGSQSISVQMTNNDTNNNNNNNNNNNTNGKSGESPVAALTRKITQTIDEITMADIIIKECDDDHETKCNNNGNATDHNNNNNNNNNRQNQDSNETMDLPRAITCSHGFKEWLTALNKVDIVPTNPESIFGSFWLLSIRAPIIILFGLSPFYIGIFLSICLIHDNFASASDLLGSCVISMIITWFIFAQYWDVPTKCFEFGIIPFDLAGIPKQSPFYIKKSNQIPRHLSFGNKIKHNNADNKNTKDKNENNKANKDKNVETKTKQQMKLTVTDEVGLQELMAIGGSKSNSDSGHWNNGNNNFENDEKHSNENDNENYNNGNNNRENTAIEENDELEAKSSN